MGNRVTAILIAAGVLLFIVYSSVFVVNERQQAIVIRFGQIQDVKGFRNGLTPVKTKTGWGIMDHQGQWIVEPQYKDIIMV